METKHGSIRKDLCAFFDYYDANPELFLWVYAMDYFVCHDSHNLGREESLSKYRNSVVNLVLRRFLKWYGVPSICKLAIGGMFDEIQRQSKAAQGRTDCYLTVFSAHDVTLLPFIVALRTYEDQDIDTLEYDDVWPTYACAGKG